MISCCCHGKLIFKNVIQRAKCACCGTLSVLVHGKDHLIFAVLCSLFSQLVWWWGYIGAVASSLWTVPMPGPKLVLFTATTACGKGVPIGHNLEMQVSTSIKWEKAMRRARPFIRVHWTLHSTCWPNTSDTFLPCKVSQGAGQHNQQWLETVQMLDEWALSYDSFVSRNEWIAISCYQETYSIMFIYLFIEFASCLSAPHWGTQGSLKD